MTEHTKQRVEFRYEAKRGLQFAWLVGCEACGDKRTGFTSYPGELIAAHNKQVEKEER
jgi:hypothetical protein